jgi:hypothetical protein
MSEETVRTVLTQTLDSPVEVGTYRGIDGVWVKVELDPRIENSTRPTSLSCSGTTVDEMKVRFVASTADRETIVETLRDLAAVTPADGEVSAENHRLSESEELWPHILYEGLALSEAVTCLRAIEREPLPTY